MLLRTILIMLNRLSKEKQQRLEELLKGMTRENRHEPVDWGDDRGKEILEPWNCER